MLGWSRIQPRRLRHLYVSREDGSFLVVAVLFLSFVLTLVLSTMSVVASRVQDVRFSRNLLTARVAAESGISQEIADIKQARDYAAIQTAFNGIDAIDTVSAEGSGGYTQTYVTQPLVDSTGRVVAEYDVFVDVQGQGDPATRQVDVSCYAYVPTKADYLAGVPDAVRSDAHVTVTTQLSGSGVFDYSYFINHWGWFFGNNIVSNGSVRSNGQFDFGGYSSMVNGSPRYLSSDGTKLAGYLDDNGDGLKDGSDGGAYSGMAIVNEGSVKGMGALKVNQHEYDGSVPMPNISDLTYYEQRAIDEGATISVGATKVFTGVLGDSPAEKRHLYLEGTAVNPIRLDGPVVVRGSVIISGYVTGQGSIFAGGNVYVPKSLVYVNAPATPRPASNDQATVEAWRQAAASKDALGLYSAEHIVIGNYTDSQWQSYVSSWVNHPYNKSIEDAGLDGIHNTKAGMDGVLGTADDDTLEGDGTWTVTLYTAEDQAKGIIPPGKSVGDVVPGSGEDIDGDGKKDNATQMSDFNIPSSLSSTLWDGNAPPTPTAFSSVSTLNIPRIDATLYTNHTLAALMIVPSNQDIQFNGAIISRNESIIYGARNIIMNHDERLSGGGGETFGMSVPVSWKPLTLASWEYDTQVAPETLAASVSP
ncbi:MAG: hypothetical protein HY721_12675 [Planctomycetes bacterium]|nr:hypothetical protein [Planctomycetota bacterium]